MHKPFLPFIAAWSIPAVATWPAPVRAETAVVAPGPMADENTLIIEPAALRNSKGAVRCLAFRSTRGFPSKRSAAFAEANATIVDNRAACVFQDLPAGVWAVSFIHDEDGDGELNTNIFGVPTEGYGFTRNASGTFGPPDFADAAIRYDGGALRLKLKVRY